MIKVTDSNNYSTNISTSGPESMASKRYNSKTAKTSY